MSEEKNSIELLKSINELFNGLDNLPESEIKDSLNKIKEKVEEKEG